MVSCFGSWLVNCLVRQFIVSLVGWLVCLVSWFDVLLVVWLASWFSWLVVSNWILVSCQQHRVTSGEERERGLVIR